MICVCCGSELARARDLPETRGWLRAGDRLCIHCDWVFPRELLGDADVVVTRCRIHAEGSGGRQPRRTPTP